jgi:arylesterase/paraoxonase
MVLHQPTGIVYLACSTPSSRVHWTPALARLNASGISSTDYIGTYNPQTSAITRFTLSDFPTSDREGPQLSVHGMDVVPSSKDPKDLWVYLVNHRMPRDNGDPRVVGADSSVEVFKTRVGSGVLRHVRTYDDPAVIITPNDLVGASDGKSFYFTNDHGEKTGMVSCHWPFLERLTVRIRCDGSI